MSNRESVERKHREYEHQHNLYKTKKVDFKKEMRNRHLRDLLHWFMFGVGSGVTIIIFDYVKTLFGF